jgi:hypothetical protein
MLPNFLLEESVVRESGESEVFDLAEHNGDNLLLTLGITHAVEQESVDIDIIGSSDGENWSARPLASFTQKFYCGTYQTILPRSPYRYVKAMWRTRRWARGGSRPFFRLYLFVQPARVRALAGAA